MIDNGPQTAELMCQIYRKHFGVYEKKLLVDVFDVTVIAGMIPLGEDSPLQSSKRGGVYSVESASSRRITCRVS